MKQTEGLDRVANKRLGRLENFLDVVYALLFVEMLIYLPRFEDMRWVGEPLGVLQLFIDAPSDTLRVIIGSALTLLYWNLSAQLLGPLSRTNAAHVTASLGQMALVCLFLYFAIADPTLAAGAASTASQSLCLTAAGFVGVIGWAYACKHELVAPEFDAQDQHALARRALVEPLTALLTVPLAFVDVLVWMLGWLVLPLCVRAVLRWARPISPATPRAA